MTVTFNLYYSGKNHAAQQFAKEMEASGIADQIRSLDGNLRYEYFQPLNDPETILLIDSWADKSILDRYHNSPVMAQVAKLRDKYDLHMKAESYIPNQVDDSEAKFIRK